MQRVREQQQRRPNISIFRRKHRSLAPAVRMARDHDRSVGHIAHARRGFSNSRAIFSRRRWQWRALLQAERQVVPQNQSACFAQCLGDGNQQRSLAARAGSMSESDSKLRGFVGTVEMFGHSCIIVSSMCRSIKVLRRPEAAATPDEVSAAALQFVRKVSGFRAPSQANRESFEAAVAEIARTTGKLLADIRSE